jgi:hypothetical protein
MTAQMPERLIFEGCEYSMCSEPLGAFDVTPNIHPVAIRASASLLRESASEARGCVA